MDVRLTEHRDPTLNVLLAIGAIGLSIIMSDITLQFLECHVIDFLQFAYFQGTHVPI